MNHTMLLLDIPLRQTGISLMAKNYQTMYLNHQKKMIQDYRPSVLESQMNYAVVLML